jgi:hypothetical protein
MALLILKSLRPMPCASNQCISASQTVPSASRTAAKPFIIRGLSFDHKKKIGPVGGLIRPGRGLLDLAVTLSQSLLRLAEAGRSDPVEGPAPQFSASGVAVRAGNYP